MKQIIYLFAILIVCYSCNSPKQTKQENTVQQQTVQDAPKDSPQSSVSKEKAVIQQVKNHRISKSFTAGQVLDSLAAPDGIVSWQTFTPEDYQNDSDIIGIVGSCEISLYMNTISYKLAYLYQYSTKKIMFYVGFRGEEQISEFDFITNYHQKKMLK